MEGGSRWWEFYFVRYAIGTLVGMAIMNFAGRINPDFKELLFFGIDQKENIFAGASLQVAYGLLFCYVASIPILVMHAARFAVPHGIMISSNWVFLEKAWKSLEKNPWFKSFLALAFVAVLAYAILGLLFYLIKNISNEEFLVPILMVLTLIVLLAEYICVIAFFVRRESIYQGIKILSKVREKNMNRGGFIDSYRHMREHGNSILIVILEVVLGATLLGLLHLIAQDNQVVDKVGAFAAWSIPLLLFWMLPGAAVWLLATWVERRFVFDEDKSG